MTAIILAAGYGTRLYPLTLDKPKALLEVGGKTILDRLVEKIKLVEECKRIIVVTNEKFHKNFETWAKEKFRSRNEKFSVPGTEFPEIDVINDKTKDNETRLGAIGDINLVLSKTGAKDDLLITGSDNLFELDLREFVQFGREKSPFSSIALFDVKNTELAKRYGICSLDKNLQVTDFEEKPASPKSTLAATALYFIPKEKILKIFDYMKTDLTKDAPGNLMKWLAKNDGVFGYVLTGAWYDIGDIKSLKEADEEFRIKGGKA
ncbi:MAG: nucleotidyltransferase family protein [Candidatus Omnitrophota bacterium]